MFSGSNYPLRSTGMLYDQTGSRISNMAACKQEVHIYQLVYVIETKFWRLYLCFWGHHIGFSTSGLIVQQSRWMWGDVGKPVCVLDAGCEIHWDVDVITVTSCVNRTVFYCYSWTSPLPSNQAIIVCHYYNRLYKWRLYVLWFCGVHSLWSGLCTFVVCCVIANFSPSGFS